MLTVDRIKEKGHDAAVVAPERYSPRDDACFHYISKSRNKTESFCLHGTFRGMHAERGLIYQ
jgi:hypothetical protein